jgi:hypothetical protein
MPDKVAAIALLAKMCGWNQVERVELGVNSLTAYLLELRAQPLGGGRILPVEGRELPLGDGENADTDSQT